MGKPPFFDARVPLPNHLSMNLYGQTDASRKARLKYGSIRSLIDVGKDVYTATIPPQQLHRRPDDDSSGAIYNIYRHEVNNGCGGSGQLYPTNVTTRKTIHSTHRDMRLTTAVGGLDDFTPHC